MEGDPVVDQLMKPVRATIEHYVKNQAGVFSIYNRAYEAVMNSMVVIDTMREQLSKANARAEAAERELEKLESALRAIQDWTKAYPLDVFPEPDMNAARVALAEHGIELDQIGASALRYVIKGVKEIVDKALEGKDLQI